MTTRLRFAPSPTGYLHVGGLRTALFSFLYAKHHQGQFIFRLEDTDRQRLVEGAEAGLVQMLEWAGLQIDEGPHVEGPFGPYRQSERLDHYQKYAQKLLDDGNAYHCFCSKETLDQMREEQAAKGEPTKYDQRCRHLTDDEVQARLAKGESSVIRMKTPDVPEVLNLPDLIHGTIAISTEQLDDQVIVKADGFPTYHLAVVVDDHLMQISHVVRGEEWISSYPKHSLLFRYLGWEPPQFAHLPLILNTDRSKLSKRQGSVAVEEFRDEGYLPEALVNFLALLGWHGSDDEEFFSLDQLIDVFSFERVGKTGSVFDREKLNWMNAHYIRQLDEEALFQKLMPYVESTDYAHEDEATLRQVFQIIQPRIQTLKEVQQHLPFFFNTPSAPSDPELLAALKKEESQTVLQEFVNRAQDHDVLDQASFKQIMKGIQKEAGIKGPALWHPVRFALTHEEQGPDLAKVVSLFGKDKCIEMLKQVLN